MSTGICRSRRRGLAPRYRLPDSLGDKTWLYCPEDACAFYRVTPFSLFSPAHVPDVEKHCSFLVEISQPGHEAPMKGDGVVPRVRSEQADGAAVVSKNPQQNPYGSGLACAVGAEEAVHFSRLYAKAEAPKCLDFAEILGDILEINDGG